MRVPFVASALTKGAAWRFVALALFVPSSEANQSPPSAPPRGDQSSSSSELETWEIATIAGISAVAFFCCAYAAYLQFTMPSAPPSEDRKRTSAESQPGLVRDIPEEWNSRERRARNPRPQHPSLEDHKYFVDLPYDFGRGTQRFAEWIETNVRIDKEEGLDVSDYVGKESVVQRGKNRARDGARKAMQGAKRVKDVVLDDSKLAQNASSSDPSEDEESPSKPGARKMRREARKEERRQERKEERRQERKEERPRTGKIAA